MAASLPRSVQKRSLALLLKRRLKRQVQERMPQDELPIASSLQLFGISEAYFDYVKVYTLPLIDKSYQLFGYLFPHFCFDNIIE